MKSKISVWVRIGFVTLCLLLSVWILWRALPRDAQIQMDPEYAVLTARDEIITKNYFIDSCESLRFCYADLADNKRTLFCNAIPNIKIVNDEQSYVELTTNRSIHDAVSIVTGKGTLTIDFLPEHYNPVHVDDVEYDYDLGLYVDCTDFDMTIHAPICAFRTNTQTVLDFQTAPASEVYLDFSFEGTKANIYDIDAGELTLYCSGDSEVILVGAVRGDADLNIWHNTKVDATGLDAGRYNTWVSSQIFGWSCIELPAHPVFSPFGIGTLISVILVLTPVYWLFQDIRLFRKLRDAKKD